MKDKGHKQLPEDHGLSREELTQMADQLKEEGCSIYAIAHILRTTEHDVEQVLLRPRHERAILRSRVHELKAEGYPIDQIAYLVDNPIKTVKELLKEKTRAQRRAEGES